MDGVGGVGGEKEDGDEGLKGIHRGRWKSVETKKERYESL